jgi:glycerol-3-phosphate dehydrogenase (NAD(P)+)
VYLSRDVLGVELCGAFKNILAIAAGLVESLGLGNNARAALITRGLAEMARLVETLGGRPETVMGLAGMGDLLLTATGAQSRNRRFGAMLGQGMTAKAATQALGDSVVEGAFTTEAALGLARQYGLELPITQEVGRLPRRRSDTDSAPPASCGGQGGQAHGRIGETRRTGSARYGPRPAPGRPQSPWRPFPHPR